VIGRWILAVIMFFIALTTAVFVIVGGITIVMLGIIGLGLSLTSWAVVLLTLCGIVTLAFGIVSAFDMFDI